ncbi:hypothetical protein BC829DRAFT_301122 [Chytridium lagenaria]|nr:hypothetical protein BC829DRAFT_301122 [Chytridium lagenaria]
MPSIAPVETVSMSAARVIKAAEFLWPRKKNEQGPDPKVPAQLRQKNSVCSALRSSSHYKRKRHRQHQAGESSSYKSSLTTQSTSSSTIPFPRSSKAMKAQLLGLPVELLASIATHLHPHELVKLRMVCKHFYENPFNDFEFAKRNLLAQRKTKLVFYRKLRFDKLGVNYRAAFIFLEGFCHENGSLQTMCPEFRLFSSSRLRPFPMPDQRDLADALMKAVKAKRRIPNICESCAISWLASTTFVDHLRDLLREWRDDKLDANSLQLGLQQSLKYGTTTMVELFMEEQPPSHPVDSLQVAVEWDTLILFNIS